MILIFSRSIVMNTHRTSTRLFKMVGKQGLSSISLLLIRVAVGIAPALSDRSLRAAAPL